MKETINTFTSGLDMDTNKKMVSNSSYIEAFDITLTEDSSYGGVKPILGSKLISTIISASNFGVTALDLITQELGKYINVHALIPVQISFDSVKSTGLVLCYSAPDGFTTSPLTPTGDDNFRIQFLTLDENGDINNSKLVYEKKGVSGEYTQKFVDYQVSSEEDLDVIYFTNGVDSPKRIVCETTTAGAQLTDDDVSLIRAHTMKPLTANVNNTGGSLISGTYSFVVRMINSDFNTYTKWSLPSMPAVIASREVFGPVDSVFHAPIGSVTDKRIAISGSLNADIAANYDYYQIGVVKNIDGNGIEATTVSLLEPVYKGTATSIGTYYYGNENETTVDASEVFIDDAQIKSFETIAIKNNYLIGGNTTYADLSYDRGEVSVGTSSGYTLENISVLGGDIADPFAYPASPMYYFRDEVYRFAITYHDEDGNWSVPQILDFSDCVSNSIESGVMDYKFPNLKTEPLTGSLNTEYYAMAFEIDDITNHPTWAKGFAILRAKRVRDIQFQTPIIPSIAVEPLTAKAFSGDDNASSYPQAWEQDAEVDSTVQPPEAIFGTLLPKNYRQGVSTHILRGDVHCEYNYGYDQNITGQDVVTGWTKDAGFNKSSLGAATEFVHFVFPPNNIYNAAGTTYNPYTHKGSDIVEVVDIQTFRCFLDEIEYDNDQEDPDRWANYRSVTAFQMVPVINDNYSNDGKSNPAFSSLSYIPQDNRITEYYDVSFGQNKTILLSGVPGLKGGTVLDYDGLHAENLTEGGAIPSSQPMGVIVTTKAMPDVQYKYVDDPTNTLNTTTTGTDIWVGNSAHFTNKMDPDQVGTIGSYSLSPRANGASTVDLIGSYRQVSIANVKRGLSDRRYGLRNDVHEFIFTGYYKQLTSSEVTNNTPIDTGVITGGDCSYDLHTFKISDGTYGLPDNEYVSTDSAKAPEYEEWWGKSFWVDNASYKFEPGRPIAYSGDHQEISVFLESEIRATYRDRSLETIYSNLYGISSNTINSLGAVKSPYTYQYNLDFSLPNNNKVFVPKSDLDSTVTRFPNRLNYSDVRIAGSSQRGFDRFRVGNIYDIDDSSGDISKLVKADDRLYCLQERGVSVIPILGQVLETADGSSLAVRSAEVIGIPNYISTVAGTINPNAVVKGNNGFFFADTDANDIYFVQGGQLNSITKGVSSFFTEKFNRYYNIDNKNLRAVYDRNRKEYILYSEADSDHSYDPWMIVYSEKIGAWVSQYTTDSRFTSASGCYVNGDVFFAGFMGNGYLGVFRKYDDSETNYSVLGELISPKIKFVTNEGGHTSKVFDVLHVNSSDALSTINMDTFNTYNNASQSTSMGFAIDNSKKVEGMYKIPVMRDSTGQRMRGLFAETEINWNWLEAPDQSDLISVKTKYRDSKR